MANLASAPLVNAKVYRHFAAITFAVTLCVALLANGEARQTVGDGIAQQRQAAKLRDADATKFGTRKLGDRRQAAAPRGGSFGEDYDPGYGYGSASDTGSLSSPSFHSGNADYGTDPGATLAPAGQPAILTPDEVALLSPEEQRAYVNRLRNRKTAAKPADEPHVLAAIEAGSRARSGSAASD